MSFSLKLLSLYLYTLCLTPMVYSSVKDGLVTTPWGKIRGVPKTSSSGFSYTSFEGIPYAKPPLGDLRFSKPVPSKGSQQTYLIADSVKPSCLMITPSLGSEDCLFLDLYAPHPAGNNSSQLDVMLYIHGGAFITYTGNLNPESLLKKNVIVAFVHYRLAALGFLSTGDDVMKGNYGLWDQRMGIQWVKDNVAAFGGNPNSITVFGGSAGSASVGYQLLAPNSNDLFQRVILQSGSPSAGWSINRNPEKSARELGRRLGCAQGTSNADLVKCLRNMDAVRLQKEAGEIWNAQPVIQNSINFFFVPVIDHEFILDEAMNLIKNYSHLQSVGALDKDVIIGVVNNESTVALSEPTIPNPPRFGDYFTKTVVPFILRQRYAVSTPKAEAAFDSFYLQHVAKESLSKEMVANAFSDSMFYIPSLELIEALSKHKTGSGHQYFYYFDYCPSMFPVKCMYHGLDALFVFPYRKSHFVPSHDDVLVAEMFVSFLTSFAKTGTPVASKTPKWTPYSPETKSYFKISAQPEVKQNPFSSRVAFWTKTLPALLNSTGVPDEVIG